MHVNNIQNQMINKINNLENNLNELHSEIKSFIVISEIKDNIYTVNHQIEIIHDIILASRLEILSKNILTIEEIKKNNITIEMYPFIKSCILHDKNELIIVISIPEFTKEKYMKINIEKIPNKNGYELDISVNSIISLNTQVFYYSDEKIY